MHGSEALKVINDFRSLVDYLRDELDWEIPEDLPLEQLTYSYTADELGLKLDAQVAITQLRPILGQQNPWGVFFIDFDKADLPIGILKRILSRVSRKKRESANAGDRALFDKNDLLFISAFGKADERRLALAHFHQEHDAGAMPTLRVLTWERQDTLRHMERVAEGLARLRWPRQSDLPEVWKARWNSAFVNRPRDAIRTAKDMAAALAKCAQDIRGAIEDILPRERPGQPLGELFEAVKATLNKDLDTAKFADTYAQTVAYGLLSKRIDQIQRWRSEKRRTLNGDLPLPNITVEALEAAIPTNPFLSELLNSFLAAGGRNNGSGVRLDFNELGLGDVVDLLNTANMEAVLDDFDKDKQGDDPVIHFYEGFLAAYDKAMKVQRGVFYTPKPVVSFIVRSVDEVLRSEFDLPLGLADTTTWGEFVAAHPEAKIPQGAKGEEPFVKILDPATGTGTFLVEVIDLIHRRMVDEAWKGKPDSDKAALWNAYVAEHLLPRLYGYELMMAPYAVAHMKISLKLADTGYDFSGIENDYDGKPRPTRARVFLTNALEPAQNLDMQLAFMNEALAHEARAANDAKARAMFTVVVGNPPYSGLSANTGTWIQRLLKAPAGEVATSHGYYEVDGVPLNERKVWLQDDYVKFIRLTQWAIERSGIGAVGLITNHGYIENPTFRGMRRSLLHTFNAGLAVIDLHGSSRKGERASDGGLEENVFDIEQGVAILVGASDSLKSRSVRHFHARGSREHKIRLLAGALDYEEVTPTGPEFFFHPRKRVGAAEYENFCSLKDLFPQQVAGIVTARDHFVTDIDARALAIRIAEFREASIPDSEIRSKYFLGGGSDKYDEGDTRGWKLPLARQRARADDAWASRVRTIEYRPFDLRYIFYTDYMVDWGRFEFMRAMHNGSNIALIFNRSIETSNGWSHVFVTREMIQHHSLSLKEVNYIAPLVVDALGKLRANISPVFLRRLADLVGMQRQDGVAHGDLLEYFGERDAFDWTYAVLHSPSYRDRYADQLRPDFARVPLPRDRDLFAELIPLGTKLVALHLLDADALPGLLADPKVRFVSNGGEPRLGRFSKEVRRDAAGRVYLNDRNWFATVPQAPWEHSVGGYQPGQKWLKDRCQTGSNDKLRPGRLLTDEDILHYRRIIVALEETGKVMADIDRVIERHGGWPDAFTGMEG